MYKPKYHNYHRAYYNTEFVKTIGIHGDRPEEKFFDQTQSVEDANNNKGIKQYNDNYQLALGSTKTTSHLPGYLGYIPFNKTKELETYKSNPYFNNSKTNHMLNYKVRLPNYQGYISPNPVNVKGVARQYCLSTKEEKFC